MRVESSNILKSLTGSDTIELQITVIKLSESLLQQMWPNLIRIGQEHNFSSFLNKRDAFIHLKFNIGKVLIKINPKSMILIFFG